MQGFLQHHLLLLMVNIVIIFNRIPWIISVSGCNGLRDRIRLFRVWNFRCSRSLVNISDQQIFQSELRYLHLHTITIFMEANTYIDDKEKLFLSHNYFMRMGTCDLLTNCFGKGNSRKYFVAKCFHFVVPFYIFIVDLLLHILNIPKPQTPKLHFGLAFSFSHTYKQTKLLKPKYQSLCLLSEPLNFFPLIIRSVINLQSTRSKSCCSPLPNAINTYLPKTTALIVNPVDGICSWSN